MQPTYHASNPLTQQVNMVKGNTFSRLFHSHKRSNSATIEPPPYDVLNEPETRIQGTDIPQWRWSNAECRVWLRKFLVEKCGLYPGLTERITDELKGFGANLYLRSRDDWRKMTYLGRVGADGIYALLCGYSRRVGATPKGVRNTAHSEGRWE
jgi:hypothetical protein